MTRAEDASGRVGTEISEAEYDDDDLAAAALLRDVFAGSGLDHAFAPGTRPVAPAGVGLAQQALASHSPMAELAFRMLAVATMKAQARGRLPRQAHEWTDQVLALDLSADDDWMLLSSHLPLAVAAGISVSDIEALKDGRLEALDTDARQHVEFVRAVTRGDVTDELWARQVAVVGSERGVVEQLCLVFQITSRVRIAQALGATGMTDIQFAELRESYRHRRDHLPDIAAYERFYDRVPWPRATPPLEDDPCL